MPVEAEVVVTRPTMPHLAETVDVLTRVGVRTISLRRLTALDVGAAEFVLLSPRMSLLADDLERAATVALQRRARLVIRDFPLCVAPRLRRLFARSDAEVWLTADGALESRVEPGPGCADCPGAPACAGAPADYVSRFGWEEFADPAPIAIRIRRDRRRATERPPLGTMALSWHGPRRVRCAPAPTRIATCRTRADARRPREAGGGRALSAGGVAAGRRRAARPSERGRAALRRGPSVPARRMRRRGRAPSSKWSDVELRRLKDLQRIDVALYGPDATSHDAHCGIAGSFAATLRGVERLARADVDRDRRVRDHPRGTRDCPIRRRVEPRRAAGTAAVPSRGGGILAGGPRRVRAPIAAGRGAVGVIGGAAALPVRGSRPRRGRSYRCRVRGRAGRSAFAFGRRVERAPCGSDPVGAFGSCDGDGYACTVTGCPGTALGWQRNARSKRWMQDS